MPLRRVIARQPLRDFPGQWWFAGFVVCGLLSALVVHVPPATFLTGAFVISQGPALRLGGRPGRLERAAPGDRGARRRRADRVVPRSPTVVNLVIAGRVGGVARERRRTPARRARSSRPSSGRSRHPIDFGQFMALSFVAVAAWRAAVRQERAHARAAARHRHRRARHRPPHRHRRHRRGAGCGCRRRCGRRPCWWPCWPASRSSVVGAGRAAGDRGHGDLQRLPRREATPRPAPCSRVDSFDVAAELLPRRRRLRPVRVGRRRDDLQPGVRRARLPGRSGGWAAPPEDGRFLTDTEWPAIIGETGFFGALAFALGLVGDHRAGMRLWRARPRAARPVGRV